MHDAQIRLWQDRCNSIRMEAEQKYQQAAAKSAREKEALEEQLEMERKRARQLQDSYAFYDEELKEARKALTKITTGTNAGANASATTVNNAAAVPKPQSSQAPKAKGPVPPQPQPQPPPQQQQPQPQQPQQPPQQQPLPVAAAAVKPRAFLGTETTGLDSTLGSVLWQGETLVHMNAVFKEGSEASLMFMRMASQLGAGGGVGRERAMLEAGVMGSLVPLFSPLLPAPVLGSVMRVALMCVTISAPCRELMRRGFDTVAAQAAAGRPAARETEDEEMMLLSPRGAGDEEGRGAGTLAAKLAAARSKRRTTMFAGTVAASPDSGAAAFTLLPSVGARHSPALARPALLAFLECSEPLIREEHFAGPSAASDDLCAYLKALRVILTPALQNRALVDVLWRTASRLSAVLGASSRYAASIPDPLGVAAVLALRAVQPCLLTAVPGLAPEGAVEALCQNIITVLRAKSPAIRLEAVSLLLSASEHLYPKDISIIALIRMISQEIDRNRGRFTPITTRIVHEAVLALLVLARNAPVGDILDRSVLRQEFISFTAAMVSGEIPELLKIKHYAEKLRNTIFPPP